MNVIKLIKKKVSSDVKGNMFANIILPSLLLHEATTVILDAYSDDQFAFR